LAISPYLSFRITGLTDADVDLLVGIVPDGYKCRRGVSHRDKAEKVFVLVLHEGTEQDLLVKLIKSAPDGVYYDFFISASSRDESVVIEIPEFILDLRERVGGGICFSYTCVS
jgi:hypothetical protein